MIIGGTGYVITHPSSQNERIKIASSCKCPQAVRVESSRKEMPFGDRYAGTNDPAGDITREHPVSPDTGRVGTGDLPPRGPGRRLFFAGIFVAIAALAAAARAGLSISESSNPNDVNNDPPSPPSPRQTRRERNLE